MSRRLLLQASRHFAAAKSTPASAEEGKAPVRKQYDPENYLINSAIGALGDAQYLQGGFSNPNFGPETSTFGNDEPNDASIVPRAHEHKYTLFPNKYQALLGDKHRFGFYLKNTMDLTSDPKDNLWYRELARYIWAPEKNKYQTIAPKPRIRLIDEHGISFASGSRKTSKALVHLKAGSGAIFVNKIPYTEYFRLFEERDQLMRPLTALGLTSQFDLYCEVSGGGKMSQAGAVGHALARALQNFDPVFRPALKSQKLLRRDPRAVERKHYGRHKARKAFTWVKR